MTAQEREVDRLITLMREAPGQLGNSELEYLADALQSRIAEVGRLTEALHKIVDHESRVPESHTECAECHDAFFDDYFEVRAIARAALSLRAGE